MRVVVVSVGAPRSGLVAAAVKEYEARAARYFRLEIIEVSPATGHRGDAERARQEEAQSILRRLPAELDAWALTRSGEGSSSRDLADQLEDMGTYARPGIAFVIGGAFGLDRTVLERCVRQLSLSPMTLPHDVARLVLAEQLYRAGTILRGEPYHKGA